MTLKGVLPLSASLQAIVISTSLYGAVKAIFDALQEHGVASVAIERLNEAISNHSENIDMVKTENMLRFIDFTVPLTGSDSNLISHLNLSIPLENKVIITGENGVGKSTMMKYAVGIIPAESAIFAVLNIGHCCSSFRGVYVITPTFCDIIV